MNIPPFFVLIQYGLPHKIITRLAYFIMNMRHPWLKKHIISLYLKHYKVNMREALIEDPMAYENFNAFFTRALKPETRTIPQNTERWICPVDGTLSQHGLIDEGTLIQAKGVSYSVSSLLAHELALARMFQHGTFMTLYLAPKDYHRVHMPIAGTLEHMIYIPGSLFSVNLLSADHIPNLFARNERVCCIFSNNNERFAVIFVGALIVGSIATVWHGIVNSASSRKEPLYFNYLQNPLTFSAGDEIGRFMLGSTVILLRNRTIPWEPTLQLHQPLHLGNYLE